MTFAPLGIVLWMSFGINRISTGTAQFLFWAFAVLMGASLSTIFLVYTDGSIALTFFATAAAFASLSLYGYTTKRDLSGMGTFLLMGLVGLIVASIVNLFWMNDTFSLVIAAIGVLIFAGLTAYDTQKIKSLYFQVAGLRHDRQGRDHGRADALSRLHQHVPLPAALPRQQPRTRQRRHRQIRRARRKRRASFLRLLPKGISAYPR